MPALHAVATEPDAPRESIFDQTARIVEAMLRLADEIQRENVFLRLQLDLASQAMPSRETRRRRIQTAVCIGLHDRPCSAAFTRQSRRRVYCDRCRAEHLRRMKARAGQARPPAVA